MLGFDAAEQIDNVAGCSRASSNSGEEVRASSLYLLATKSLWLVTLIPEIRLGPPRIGHARLTPRQGEAPDDSLVIALVLRARCHTGAESKSVVGGDSGTERAVMRNKAQGKGLSGTKKIVLR